MINDLLKNKVKDLNGDIEFMLGRDKVEEGKGLEEGKTYNIKDWDYLNGDNGEYIVFIVDEDEKHFYFGGQIVTMKFKSLDSTCSEKEIEEIKIEGLPVEFEKKVSKKTKSKYTNVRFFPE